MAKQSKKSDFNSSQMVPKDKFLVSPQLAIAPDPKQINDIQQHPKFDKFKKGGK